MNVLDAVSLANRLKNDHGLFHWHIEVGRQKQFAGMCYHQTKVIRLSRFFIEGNSEKQIKDTILHEIAHALVGPFHGHNYVWRAKAKSIGCDGKRCYDSSVKMPNGKWVGRCDCKIHYRHRKPKYVAFKFQCKKCNALFLFRKEG